MRTAEDGAHGLCRLGVVTVVEADGALGPLEGLGIYRLQEGCVYLMGELLEVVVGWGSLSSAKHAGHRARLLIAPGVLFK